MKPCPKTLDDCGDVQHPTHCLGADRTPDSVSSPGDLCRSALIRLMRTIVALLTDRQWKDRDGPSRDQRRGRQWMEVRQAMESARSALTGEPSLAMNDDLWAMESRTATGFAATPNREAK